MTTTADVLDELARMLERGEPWTVTEAERFLAVADLVRIGEMGDAVRRDRTADVVTFGRVAVLAGSIADAGVIGEAGEVRLVGRPATFDEAVAWVRATAPMATGRTLTGFCLDDLVELAGHDHLVLAEMAEALRAAGLEAVAEAAVDRLGVAELASEVIRAVRHGGLAVERLVVGQAVLAERPVLIDRSEAIARDAGGIVAFAPLPRRDPADLPSTGYDDVKTVALARLYCRSIERIQVDWPLYGPKLAQVALTFGASDIDGVAALDLLGLGHRRSPAEDVTRQIQAASARAVERDGRFRVRS
jgi:hypothetical protein